MYIKTECINSCLIIQVYLKPQNTLEPFKLTESDMRVIKRDFEQNLS